MKCDTILMTKLGGKDFEILVASDGTVSIDAINDVPREEVLELVDLIIKHLRPAPTVTRTKPTAKKRKVLHKATGIGGDTLIQWNKKFSGNPARFFRKGSLAEKVTNQAYRLAKAPIKRRDLERAIATAIGVPPVKVNYTLSHMIHTHKMLGVVK